MSVDADDIKIYKSAVVSDAAGNGGGIGTAPAESSLFPTVSPAERAAGIVRYRKVFLKNEEAVGNLAAYNLRVGIKAMTPAADYIRLKAGTNTDTQAQASAYTDWLGAGALDADAESGASSFDVEFDTDDGVYAGSLIRIHDGTNSEFHTVDTVSWNGAVATITLDGTTLANGFAAATPTIVSAYPTLGDLAPSSSSWAETSAAGTYDETAYPLIVYNKGTVIDSWTLTFTSDTAFSVVGANSGSVGTGTISGDFKPVNGASWYFNLRAAGWGGTWAEGDTVTFLTTHAAKGLWVAEIVPQGAASYTTNPFDLSILFQSA